MKHYALILAAGALLAGCYNQPQSSEAAGVEFRVDRLFTYDGCTVYRFKDGGVARYFARCGAATSGTSWTESCGKGCSRPMNVQTTQAGCPDAR